MLDRLQVHWHRSSLRTPNGAPPAIDSTAPQRPASCMRDFLTCGGAPRRWRQSPICLVPLTHLRSVHCNAMAIPTQCQASWRCRPERQQGWRPGRAQARERGPVGRYCTWLQPPATVCRAPPVQAARSTRLGTGVAAVPAAQPAALFWDLDNLRPGSVERTLVAAHRLCSAIEQLIGGGPPSLRAYANQATAAGLSRGNAGALAGSRLAAALALLGGELKVVNTRR